MELFNYEKNIHFLKVVLSLIVVFTSSFVMSSCGEEETTSIVSDYEQFENNFDEHYPDGYTMEDGWYSVRSVHATYYVDSDQQDVNYIYGTGCTDFVGDLELSDYQKNEVGDQKTICLLTSIWELNIIIHIFLFPTSCFTITWLVNL